MDDENEEAKRALGAMVAPRVDEDRQFVLGSSSKILEDRHRRQGAVLNLDLPTFLVQGTDVDVTTVRAALASRHGRQKPTVLPWGWDLSFGAVITISVMAPGTNWLRCEVASRDPILLRLREEAIRLVVVGPQTFVAFKATWPNPTGSFNPLIERVGNHVPSLGLDHSALFWEAVMAVPSLAESPQERLAVGWLNVYEEAMRTLKGHMTFVERKIERMGGRKKAETELKDDDRYSLILDHISSTPVELVRAFIGRYQANPKIQALVGELRENKDVPSVMQEYEEGVEHQRELQATDDPAIAISMGYFVQHLQKCVLLSPFFSNCGARIPVIDNRTRGFSHVEIEPQRFPTGLDPIDYWKGYSETLMFLTSLQGDEFLMECTDDSIQHYPRAENIAEAHQAADALNQEAMDQKKWAIPAGALVELTVGPFVSFELYGAGYLIDVYARDVRGAVMAMQLELDTKHITWAQLSSIVLDTTERERLHAAMRLLLSAVVRDFLVVEERSTVFQPTLRRSSRARNPMDDGPRIVYLPRVKYSSRTDTEKCKRELDTASITITKHAVAPHLRRCDNPSPEQLRLAARYRVEVQPGFTFVRPHARGGKPRDVVYRSRSALAALYETTPAKVGVDSEGADWFRFERDVRAWLEREGFEVDHVSSGKRGDHGVDLFASKGSGLEHVSWFVQCKCYRLDRKVGPSQVRDLAGAVTNASQGTRGVIVTTSSFTREAIAEATQLGITLIDGRELAVKLRPVN